MLDQIRPPVMEVQSSGYGPDSYPIEVGVVLDSGKRYCTLVLPLESWTYWDRELESKHFVSQSALQTHGKPIVKVARDLNHLLKRKTVYLGDWDNEKRWLDMIFEATGILKKFRMEPIEDILSQRQVRGWSETKSEVVELTASNRQRASLDAYILQETFVRSMAGGM